MELVIAIKSFIYFGGTLGFGLIFSLALPKLNHSGFVTFAVCAAYGVTITHILLTLPDENFFLKLAICVAAILIPLKIGANLNE